MACEDGIADGCSGLGSIYQNAKGSVKSDEKALEYYEKACTLGNKFSCAAAGQMYSLGRPTKSYPKAVEYYEKGCSDSFCPPSELEELGNLLLSAPNDEPAKGKAGLFFTMALQGYVEQCDSSPGNIGNYGLSIDGCEQAVRLIEKKLVPANSKFNLKDVLERQRELCQYACDDGQGEWCAELAKFYEEGRVGKKSPTQAKKLYTKARKLLQKSCNDRDPWVAPDCFDLGELYAEGKGGAKSTKQAQNFYKKGEKSLLKSCNSGEGHSCEQLANFYSASKAGKPEEAKKLYEKACSLGIESACGK